MLGTVLVFLLFSWTLTAQPVEVADSIRLLEDDLQLLYDRDADNPAIEEMEVRLSDLYNLQEGSKQEVMEFESRRPSFNSSTTPLMQNQDCQKFSSSKKINLDAPTTSAKDLLKLLIACTKQNIDIDGFYFGVEPVKCTCRRWPFWSHRPFHAFRPIGFLTRSIIGPFPRCYPRGCGYTKSKDKSETGLMWAAKNGHDGVVSSLIKNGAGLDIQDKSGLTALLWAAEAGHDGVVSILITSGADIHIQDNKRKTALLRAAGNGYGSIVSSLLDSGADFYTADEHGLSALDYAAVAGHDSIFSSLIKLKAARDTKSPDKHNWTALMIAAKYGYDEIVSTFIASGADLNAQNSAGETALIRAAWNGHASVVSTLLDSGADISIQDNSGKTALMWAEEKKHEDVVSILDRGVDKKKEESE